MSKCRNLALVRAQGVVGGIELRLSRFGGNSRFGYTFVDYFPNADRPRFAKLVSRGPRRPSRGDSLDPGPFGFSLARSGDLPSSPALWRYHAQQRGPPRREDYGCPPHARA